MTYNQLEEKLLEYNSFPTVQDLSINIKAQKSYFE